MKRPIKKIFCSLIGVSLIISAAGCNGGQTGSTQSDSETTAATSKAETTAATEASAEAVASSEGTAIKAENKSFKYRPGDFVNFGKYEQDNNKSNGKEDIEWLVLAREGNKLLLISTMALDQKPYNEKRTNVTWETCSLRKWLNESFYESAFDEEDKSYIVSTNVTADKNPTLETAQGNDTKDKVFLLSIQEFHKYFASEKGVLCFGSKSYYVKDKYVDKGLGSKTQIIKEGIYYPCWWWLRTSGDSSQHAASVVYYAETPVSNHGYLVDRKYDKEAHGCGVRPAMWVELPDFYTTQTKHLYAWVEGYVTVRTNYYDSKKGKDFDVDIPNMPCQILYVDGFPSTGREVREARLTDQAVRDWLEKNFGDAVGSKTENTLLWSTASLEKTA